MEALFRQLDGVVSTAVGYSGGSTENPSYKQVCTNTTGHAEAVRVEYDPARVAYERLLELFWNNHDPTTPDRQGPNVGSQYRSVIFTHDAEQAEAARASLRELEESGRYRRPIVTEIIAAQPFYRAEEYHQNYYEKNGFACPVPR